MQSSKLNPKSSLIWFVTLALGIVIFVAMSLLGYNAESGNVVKAGSVEINPEYVKILLSLSALLIPWVNSRWPGFGNALARLLNLFVDPKEDESNIPETMTETRHLSDLHEIGLQFAVRKDIAGIKLCTQLFERMLSNQMPVDAEVDVEKETDE